jgi:hypothetical protein
LINSGVSIRATSQVLAQEAEGASSRLIETADRISERPPLGGFSVSSMLNRDGPDLDTNRNFTFVLAFDRQPFPTN